MVQLSLGFHPEVISSLRIAVAEHPRHEGLREGLMTALCAAGRPAEALAVYREGRKRIVGELGIEPGARLRSLVQAILGSDRALPGTGQSRSSPV
jgi:pentatricopeptide repeat protein